jgi:two-component system, NarL family, response regulator DevR
MQTIRILLVDDHEIVRMGMRALLEQQPHLRIIAEASTGEEAIHLTEQHAPDVVVMDIRMAGMTGVEATREITSRFPKTRVVILTSFAEDELVLSAIRAGAAGYVLKRIGGNELVHTIEAVARGESALDPAMLAAIFQEVKESGRIKDAGVFSDLSAQELRILKLIADGLTNREIAARLFLGEGTVRNYVSSVLSKLHLSNRAEAAAFAVQHNLKDHLKDSM